MAIKQHIMKFWWDSCTSVETLLYSIPIRNKSYEISYKKEMLIQLFFRNKSKLYY